MATKKEIAQREHFKKRLAERIGLYINRIDRLELIRSIQSGKFQPVCSISNRISVFQAEFKGASFRILYDRIRHQPISAFSNDMIIGYRELMEEIHEE